MRENRIADLLAFMRLEIKHAWDNRRCLDCSLVAWIFRISCYERFGSHCPGCGPDFTGTSFHQNQISGSEWQISPVLFGHAHEKMPILSCHALSFFPEA